MIRNTTLGGLAALACLLLATAHVSAAESAYTTIDLDDCTITKADDFGASWACEGYDGMPITVSEGDIRFFIAYGVDGTDEKLAEQTLPPFNTLGPRIEWRLSPTGEPVATIVRYFTDREDPEPDAQVLVVSKLEPGNACHVAYVDAKANANPNVLARQAADEIAPNFDCATDEVEVMGKFEAWDY